MIEYDHLNYRSHPHCVENQSAFMRGYDHNLNGGKIRDNPFDFCAAEFDIWESGFRAYRDWQIAMAARPKAEVVVSAAKLKQMRNKQNRKARGDECRQAQLRAGKK
jgi:hypothetical protein